MDTPNDLRDTERNGDGQRCAVLANGSSGSWDVSIDESAGERDRYYAHIEGPAVYFYFELEALPVIGRVIQYLQHPVNPHSTTGDATEGYGPLSIGKFGRASVNLAWDDEYQDRCFLIVGVSGKQSLRFSFCGEEIKHLSSALRQVEEDLGDCARPVVELRANS